MIVYSHYTINMQIMQAKIKFPDYDGGRLSGLVPRMSPQLPDPRSGGWYVLLLPADRRRRRYRWKRRLRENAGAPFLLNLIHPRRKAVGVSAHPSAQPESALAFVVFSGLSFASVFAPPDRGVNSGALTGRSPASNWWPALGYHRWHSVSAHSYTHNFRARTPDSPVWSCCPARPP